jgi:hypothetical protein
MTALGTFIGIFITHDNKTQFKASPKNMTMNEMRELYKNVSSNKNDYIGKYATIEYEDISIDGVPLRPKFLQFRYIK